jgi:hypothetical protein
LVDWRRGAGDAVAYYKFYEAMRLRLKDLVAEGKPGGNAGEGTPGRAQAGSQQPLA